MIRATMIKTFREYGRWAVVGAVGLSALLAFLLYSARSRYSLSLVGDTYMAVTLLAMCGVAFVAGLAVTLPDLRRGHWGFAVHRPQRRWKLFLGTFLGAAAMFSAAGLFAVGVAALCATNSRFTRAPFDVAMVKPSLFFVIGGLPWLACGMLVAARRARWVGSRMFPVVLPFVATFLAYNLSIYFAEAAGIMLLATLILSVAAGAFYCHNGEYEPQPWWAKPMAALAVFAGACAVLAIAVNIAVEGVRAGVGTPPVQATPFEQYALDAAGRPYLQRVNYATNTQDAFDLDGHPIVGDAKRALYKNANNFANLSASDPDDPGAPRYVHLYERSFLKSTPYVTATRNDSVGLNWYFVNTRRTLEAYEQDGTYVGCLGPDNTFDTTGRRLSFPAGSGVSVDRVAGRIPFTTLSSPTEFYFIDFERRRVRLLYRADPAHPMRSATLLTLRPYTPDELRPDSSDPDEWLPDTRVVSVTDQGITMAPTEGQHKALSIPFTAPDWHTTVRVSYLDDDAMAVLVNDVASNDQVPQVLTYRDGRVTTQSLKPMPYAIVPQSRLDKITNVLVPPVMLLVAVMIGDTDGMPTGWDLLPPVGGAVAALAITFVMARRRGYGRGTTVVWLTAAALLGLFVPLTLLCLRSRPARLRCPACGRKRPVDQDRCPHCAAPWPVPGDPATDVFDDGRAAA